MHDKAIEAAYAALGDCLDGPIDPHNYIAPTTMRQIIAAFLRSWEPKVTEMGADWHYDVCKHAAAHTANELESDNA